MNTVIVGCDALAESEEILANDEIIAVDLEASGLDTKTATLEGIGYGTKDNTFFIPFPNNIDKQCIKVFLQKIFNKKVIFHNAKYDMKLLLENGFPIPEKFEDTMIMSWLIDENVQHGLKPLVKEIFGREPKQWKDLKREPDLFTEKEDIVQELADYCCEDVKNTYELYFHFLPLLKLEGADVDYERVELKLIPVLMQMEMRGIKVDTSWLLEKQKEAEKELSLLEKQLTEKVRERVGDERAMFNFRSPKQIEQILFRIFYYPVVKETASGKSSTDNEVLEEIVKKKNLQENDFVPLLLQFRDLDKLHSTFMFALIEQAGLTNTIHANFLQHGTRTGRLASSDPNMQNIPARHDTWNIRHAFVPREGYKFLQADYSQIELRVLAHLSQDVNMVDTFKHGGDIHAKTMELINSDRRTAKMINFGLIYGMGPRSLAHDIKIKEDEAKKYIDNFFAGYPQVKTFIQRVQRATLQTGYVTMITGRKRRFHEFKDNRWYNMIARQAINSKIQGSAADLIKIAMIRLNPVLKELGAYQLLQVHDELIIETPIDKIEETKKVIKEVMESALALKVPLVVNIVEGERWIKE